MTDTPRTDEILALLPGGQTCDPQAVADALRPEIAKMEMEFDDWRALIESEVANLRAELANERELADEMASQINHSQCTYDPGGCHKMYAAYKQARNPAQTTGEGAE